MKINMLLMQIILIFIPGINLNASSTSILTDPDTHLTLTQKWQILQEAREEFRNGNLMSSKPKLIRLFNQGVLMTIPFLKTMNDLDEEIAQSLPPLKQTGMASSFFKGEDLSFLPIHQILLSAYDKKEDPKKIFFIASNITEGDKVRPHQELSYWYRFAANMGDVDTQFLFSQKLRLGKLGFNRNINAAFEWLERAAKRCDAETAKGKNPNNLCSILSSPGQIYFDIGALFNNGDGTPQNHQLAADYLLKSANLGFENAPQSFLKIIQNSDLSSQYIPEQKKWHRFLNTPANLYKLSILKITSPQSEEEYQQGIQDLENIARNERHPHMSSANFILGCFLSRDRNLNESNKKFKARISRAKAFLEKAYINRHSLTISEKTQLAMNMLIPSSILSRHKNDSFELLKESLRNGVNCHTHLGTCYEHGIGTPKNYEKAIEFYEQGIITQESDLNSLSIALNASGFLYLQKGNYIKAFEKFNQGIKHRFTTSYYNLGIMWRDGLGRQANWAKAIDMFLIAAEKGDKDAQYDLALMYANIGWFDEAYDWYTQSAKQGHILARQNRVVLCLEGFKKEGVSLDEIRQDLIQNVELECAESKLALAMSLSCETALGIPVNITDSIRIFESLISDPNEKISSMAKIFLTRLKPEDTKTTNHEIFEPEDQDIIENFTKDTKDIEQADIENMLNIMSKPSKSQKRLIRMASAEATPQDPVQTDTPERKPFTPPTFTDEQKSILQEFAQRKKKTNVNPRALADIIETFKTHGLWRKTASGDFLHYDDLTFSTHRSHDDSIAVGAITELMTFIKNVLQRIG